MLQFCPLYIILFKIFKFQKITFVHKICIECKSVAVHTKMFILNQFVFAKYKGPPIYDALHKHYYSVRGLHLVKLI